ncbi:hypothetical protein QE374_002250 [Microbacterium sp. SORGH_AS428]|uniref:hypothetical protein n=1 Tax=Microbacterium sp. SORGH_AS_0428 TaxID=3041788 RepID=UPI002857F27A|nr:hypothetical protein [Microbacterium sp. SORGH_AS_0428]MDR6200341.1 hypothetical protein [Microbacterium sp. SORGH_AS_0428]
MTLRRSSKTTLLAASAALLALAAAGCAPDPSPAPTGSALRASSSPAPTATATPTPTATPVAIPTDCRQILTDAVLAQLADVPLNDPAFGTAGAQADGSLTCIWGSPATDTGRLTTTISKKSRGPALDMLNALVGEGFTCYTPDNGTRCEKVWVDPQYPVNDGRTLFWRDDVLVDTQYVGLAPSGYTDAVISRVFG